MNLCIIQNETRLGESEANRKAIYGLLKESPPPKNSYILLSEMFSTGFPIQESDLNSWTEPDPFQGDIQFLKEISTFFNCFISAGTCRRKEKRENWVLTYSPKGKRIGAYQKIHLFFGGEKSRFSMGNNIGLTTVEDWRVQNTICFDLRFPELYRRGLDLEIQLITVQAFWPESRHQQWKILLQARAIENQCWVVGVNGVSSKGQTKYSGGSLILSPTGEVILDAGQKPGVYQAEIDLEFCNRWRKNFPVNEEKRKGSFYLDLELLKDSDSSLDP